MPSSLFDNLVPILRRTDGQQYAGWKAARFERKGLGCRLLADERIDVGEGVTLSADVYVPKKQAKSPAVVVFGAYCKELHTAGAPTGTNEAGSPPVFTDRGYAVVLCARRGMSGSGGEAGPLFCEQDVDDHARLISWAAEQPWCDGRVVLFGTSYYAMTQVQVAARRPPALKAFFANELDTDIARQILQYGGTVNAAFYKGWLGGNFNERLHRLRVAPVVRAILSWLLGALRPLLRALVRHRFDFIFGRAGQLQARRELLEGVAQWLFDAKTRESLGVPTAAIDRIEVPFVAVQNLGFFSFHQFGAYDLLENAGTPREGRRLIMSPPHYLPPVFDWQLEAIAFFDHVLHGTDNGYAAQARVRYWLEGADRYESADDFPVPGGAPLRLHLAPEEAGSTTQRLSREPPAEGTSSWVAVPFGAPVPAGLDEVAPQTVAWEYTAAQTTRLAGPIKLALTFSCTEIDSHVIARVGRVAKDGTYRLLSMGAVSPARRKVDEERSTAVEIAHVIGHVEPLTRGVPVELVFSLCPAPTELQAGEVLRLELGSRTDLLRGHVVDGYCQFDLPVPPYYARNTIHHGPGTYLELQRVPFQDAEGERPA